MLELADNDILIFNIAFGTFGKVSGGMKRKTLGCYSDSWTTCYEVEWEGVVCESLYI